MDITGKDLFIREISSRLESLDEISLLLEEIFSHYNLTEEQQFDIKLTLIEAVNNSIKHGNKEDLNKTVIVCCVKLGNILRFKIQDEGKGFTYKNKPTSDIEKTKPNGRGVFLMQKICDKYTITDNGRITEIDFKI